MYRPKIAPWHVNNFLFFGIFLMKGYIFNKHELKNTSLRKEHWLDN